MNASDDQNLVPQGNRILLVGRSARLPAVTALLADQPWDLLATQRQCTLAQRC